MCMHGIHVYECLHVCGHTHVWVPMWGSKAAIRTHPPLFLSLIL